MTGTRRRTCVVFAVVALWVAIGVFETFRQVTRMFPAFWRILPYDETYPSVAFQVSSDDGQPITRRMITSQWGLMTMDSSLQTAIQRVFPDPDAADRREALRQILSGQIVVASRGEPDIYYLQVTTTEVPPEIASALLVELLRRAEAAEVIGGPAKGTQVRVLRAADTGRLPERGAH